jgi:hypothetical protein
MHMVWHDHEPHTPGRLPIQLGVQTPKQKSFGLIVIQQSATAVT